MGVGGVLEAGHLIRSLVKMSGLSSCLTMGAGLLLPVSLPPLSGALLSNNNNNNTAESFQFSK